MRPRLLLVAMAVAFGFIACGENPPTSPVGPSPPKSPDVAPTLTSISIAGPTEVVPGSVTQFTAIGRYSDGSTKDLTTIAGWSANPAATLRHVGSGRVEAVVPGEATVFLNVASHYASMQVLSLPRGTFKVSGTVRDGSGEIENVVVEVASGTGSGSRSTTESDGKYALYGVAGSVLLRASAPGYATQDIAATVTRHAVRDIDLDTSTETADLSGPWTLTVSTSAACSNTWPPAARRREITAVITQEGTRVRVRFGGPTVLPTFDNPGRIAGSAFSLTLLGDYDRALHGLIDRVSPTEWIGVYGTMTGMATRTLITGSLTGMFEYYVTPPTAQVPNGYFNSSCTADPAFELRRR